MNEFKTIIETYNFDCAMCGNCCTGDMTVRLNLFDFYKIGRFLKLDHTDQLFKKNLVRLNITENNSWQPVIRYKQKPFKFCPFLNNELGEGGDLTSLCELHPDHKPLICAMAPVGRIADLGNAEDEFIFVKPAPDCRGVESDKVQYLDDLLKRYEPELHLQKRFFHLLGKCVALNFSKEQYRNSLYSFPVNDEFDQILMNIERRL